MTYSSQVDFNLWNQMYLPESEVVASPVSYGCICLNYINTAMANYHGEKIVNVCT